MFIANGGIAGITGFGSETGVFVALFPLPFVLLVVGVEGDVVVIVVSGRGSGGTIGDCILGNTVGAPGDIPCKVL